MPDDAHPLAEGEPMGPGEPIDIAPGQRGRLPTRRGNRVTVAASVAAVVGVVAVAVVFGAGVVQLGGSGLPTYSHGMATSPAATSPGSSQAAAAAASTEPGSGESTAPAGSPTGSPSISAAPPPNQGASSSIPEILPPDGVKVVVSGSVQTVTEAAGSRAYACPPFAVAAVGRPSGAPAVDACTGGIPLQDSRGGPWIPPGESDSRGRADFALTGHLDSGHFVVEQATPTTPTEQGMPAFHPNCATPAGGWAPYDDAASQAEEAYERSHGGIVERVTFWPTLDQHGQPLANSGSFDPDFTPSADTPQGMALIAEDPAAVRRALGDRFPRTICVIKSNYTKAQVQAARDMLERSVDLATFTMFGGISASSDGQVSVSAAVLWETDSLRARLAKQPPGLIQVDAWMTPVKQ